MLENALHKGLLVVTNWKFDGDTIVSPFFGGIRRLEDGRFIVDV